MLLFSIETLNFPERFLLPLLLVNFSSRDSGHAVDEFGPEEDVGVVEHAILEGHDNKLKQNETFNK